MTLAKRLRLSLLHLEILRMADAADNDTEADALRRSACLLELCAACTVQESEWPVTEIAAGGAANDNGGSR